MLETAETAARAAGEIMNKYFGKILQVDETERFDIKLQVDKLCENEIIRIIKEKFPDHAIQAEESGEQGDSEYRWIIDPLDGTVNFFCGIPVFCTSIALEKNNQPYLGVIYDPRCDELFAAEKGKGATLNGRPIHVSESSSLDELMVAIGFMKDPETIDRAVDAIAATIRRVFKCRCMGSAAIDMAYVACGRFGAYYENRIMNWDIAAGRIILSEAGGVSLEIPVSENCFNILATNKNLHEEYKKIFKMYED
jgi:myo-inositol-1(or 4)-monophosphatase